MKEYRFTPRHDIGTEVFTILAVPIDHVGGRHYVVRSARITGVGSRVMQSHSKPCVWYYLNGLWKEREEYDFWLTREEAEVEKKRLEQEER